MSKLSKSFSLKGTGKKFAIGAMVAMLGAFATFLETEIANIDFGAFTELVVAVNCIVVNSIRNFVREIKS